MQINSVSSTTFGISPMEERFANLSDHDIRKIALAKTNYEVNDKTHKRINNALFYSLPLVAGVSSLPYSSAISKFLSPDKVRFYKVAGALKTTASWGVALGAFSAVFGLRNIIEKHSQKARDFSKNNPLLTTFGTFVGGIGAMMGANKGLELASKAHIPFTVKKSMYAFKNALNKSKVLNEASKLMTKVPSSIKSIGKTGLAFAPLIVIGTSLLHSIGHERVKNRQFTNNYVELKTAQNMLREEIKAEAQAVDEA